MKIRWSLQNTFTINLLYIANYPNCSSMLYLIYTTTYICLLGSDRINKYINSQPFKTDMFMYVYVLRVLRTSNYTRTVHSCPYTSANRCGKLLGGKKQIESKKLCASKFNSTIWTLKLHIHETVKRMEIHLSFTCEPSNLSFQNCLPHFLYPHPMFFTQKREKL